MSNIPVLLLIYNRPEYTKKNIANLRKIKPKKIYIFCDGPKNERDKSLCLKTIKETEKINWKCTIKKKFLNKNLGCKDGVSLGIGWFFKKNSKGIILEDDCIPNKSFFQFCEKMFRFYSRSKIIGCITGDNFLSGKFKFKNGYYFSKYANCWGWATWKRSWNIYKKDINFWPDYKKSKSWKKNFLTVDERKYWGLIFDECYKKKIDSWAYLWTLCLWKNRLLTVTPSKNLVKNIGLSTSRKKLFRFSSPTYKTKNLNIKKIKFNNNLEIDQKADSYVFDKHFKGKIKIRMWKLLRIFNYGV